MQQGYAPLNGCKQAVELRVSALNESLITQDSGQEIIVTHIVLRLAISRFPLCC